jgi:hypothetical protein
MTNKIKRDKRERLNGNMKERYRLRRLCICNNLKG